MKPTRWTVLLLTLAVLCAPLAVRAETPDEWVALGTRVHGFFGGFIPAGIRIGLDAMERMKAEPRSLAVTYWKGQKALCPCVLDGVMLAVNASLGQGTVTVAPEPAPADVYAVIVIRDRKFGNGFKYTITEPWQWKMIGWNKLEPRARYDEATSAERLFTVEPALKP